MKHALLQIAPTQTRVDPTWDQSAFTNGIVSNLERPPSLGVHSFRSTSTSFRLVVRFARRSTLFYDEDVTDLRRPVSAAYIGMKAVEISRSGQQHARRRL